MFEKGNKLGVGRPKGLANKINGELKEMIRTALDEAGGVTYLVTCARDNPNAFLGLVGKIIPKDVNVSGGDGEPLTITIRGYSEKKD